MPKTKKLVYLSRKQYQRLRRTNKNFQVYFLSSACVLALTFDLLKLHASWHEVNHLFSLTVFAVLLVPTIGAGLIIMGTICTVYAAILAFVDVFLENLNNPTINKMLLAHRLEAHEYKVVVTDDETANEEWMLVRSSKQPSSPQETLLRATQSEETPPDQLLRPGP